MLYMGVLEIGMRKKGDVNGSQTSSGPEWLRALVMVDPDSPFDISCLCWRFSEFSEYRNIGREGGL